jgi:DNA-binding transcriptional MerR regulator
VKNLVPIGRFSTICRLSLKALRLYDEMGLLKPALVDPESGYRYYSLSQALEAERIRLLRAIEVPLDEIGRFLCANTRGAAREILERHHARLEARLEQYRAMLADVEKLANDEAMSYEVRTKELIPQQVLSIRIRKRLADLVNEAPRAFGEMVAHLGRVHAHPAGPPFALYHGSEFDEEAVDVEWCVPSASPSPASAA